MTLARLSSRFSPREVLVRRRVFPKELRTAFVVALLLPFKILIESSSGSPLGDREDLSEIFVNLAVSEIHNNEFDQNYKTSYFHYSLE